MSRVAFRIAVTTSPTLIVSAPENTRPFRAFLRNDNSAALFLGGPTVTASTGLRVESNTTIGPFFVRAGMEVFGIRSSGMGEVAVLHD